MPATSGLAGADVQEFIQAYEAALVNGEGVDLAEFLPPLHHPAYAEIHRQLAARDAAYREGRNHPLAEVVERTIWNNGRVGTPKSEARADSLPPFARDDEVTTARVLIQVQRPEEMGPGGKSSAQAPGRGSASSGKVRSNGATAERLAGAMAGMPKPSDEFLGFRM